MMKMQDQFQSLTCTSDGRFIAGAFQNVVKIFDATGKYCFQFVAHEDNITYIKYSPDDRLLVTVVCSSKVKIWDAQTGKQKLDPFRIYDSQSLSFSRKSEYLAFLENWHTIRILNLKNNTFITYSDKWLKCITSIDFSPNRPLIIASDSFSYHTRILNTRILNTRTGIYTIHRIDHCQLYGTQYSPNGKIIAQGSYEGTILVSDVKTKKTICRFKGHLRNFILSFSHNGDYLVQQSWNNCIRVWDIVKRRSQIIQQENQELLDIIQFTDNKRYLLQGAFQNNSYRVIQINDEWPE